MRTMILLLFLYLPCSICRGDLQFPGCPGRDRCSAMFDMTDFRFRNCECDSACVDFGDCCEDYPRGNSPKKNNDHKLKCVDLGFDNIGAYMAVGCPPGADPELSGRCKDEYSPVTVFPDGPFYVNEHCAICNGHSLDNLIRWNLTLNCKLNKPSNFNRSMILEPVNNGVWKIITKENSLKLFFCDLVFNFSTVKGHSHQPIDKRSEDFEHEDLFALIGSDVERRDFTKSLIAKMLKRKKTTVSRRALQSPLGDLFAFGIPRCSMKQLRLSYLLKSSAMSRGALRLCRAGQVSECPDEWQDDRVRAACGEYAAAVYGLRGDYRNPHCALCNGEDMRQLRCNRYKAKGFGLLKRLVVV